jgi:hypothetical protein
VVHADTYIDVRSASLNRWSLKQAQYIQSRQKIARALGMNVHFPIMEGGYAFSGHYDHFFTSTGEEEATVENLRKSTLEEARRSARLAELAVEGIAGLNEVLSAQIEALADSMAQTHLLVHGQASAQAKPNK